MGLNFLWPPEERPRWLSSSRSRSAAAAGAPVGPASGSGSSAACEGTLIHPLTPHHIFPFGVGPLGFFFRLGPASVLSPCCWGCASFHTPMTRSHVLPFGGAPTGRFAHAPAGSSSASLVSAIHCPVEVSHVEFLGGRPEGCRNPIGKATGGCISTSSEEIPVGREPASLRIAFLIFVQTFLPLSRVGRTTSLMKSSGKSNFRLSPASARLGSSAANSRNSRSGCNIRTQSVIPKRYA